MADYTKEEKEESFARVLMAVGKAPTIPELNEESFEQSGWYNGIVSVMPAAAEYDETVYEVYERCVSNTRVGGMSWFDWVRQFYLWQGASIRVFYSIAGEMTMERYRFNGRLRKKYLTN